MLRISKMTDYAMVVLSYLAWDPLRVVSAATIAQAVHLTAPTVSKILKILLEAGLVTSYRGTGGGYQLARPAQQISVAEVVSAVEGNLAMTECCAPVHACAIHSLCGIKENWQIINRVILTALAGLMLSDMTKPLHTHPLVLHGIPIKEAGLKHGK